MSRKTGIFGGTFDPVHNGHLACVRSYLASGWPDRLMVLPAPFPPHKTDDQRASFEHRLEMLRIAFRGWKTVMVSDLESRLESPSFTVRTLRYLQESSPSETFYLCLGEDSLVNFTSWYRYREILQRVELLVAERPGYDTEGVPREVLDRTTFVNHDPVEISSTFIRNKSVWVRSEELPKPVSEYIVRNRLYGVTGALQNNKR